MFTDADRRIAELAVRQHHVFTREQASDVGFTRHQITDRVASGVWQRVGNRVYAPAGAVVEARGLVHGATLVIAGSVASHEAAGELNRFPLVPPGRVVVSRPDSRPNRSDLAEVRRLVDFRPEEHTIVDGIPTTSPLRTAADLAAVFGAKRYQQMIDELIVRGDITAEDLADFAVRWCRQGRRGSSLLWKTVDARGPGYVAPESQLEAKGFAVLAAGGFPEPERQLDLPWRSGRPGRVDCGYSELRVLIEWDSRKHHMIEAQFEDDRRRDDEAVAEGWRPLRFTWKMLHQEVDWVWAKVAGARHHAQLGRRPAA